MGQPAPIHSGGEAQLHVDTGNSVLVIEFNLDIFLCSDWIIDLGPEGGEKGGEIVVVGTPEKVVEHPTSQTGRYLKQVLVKHPANHIDTQSHKPSA